MEKTEDGQEIIKYQFKMAKKYAHFLKVLILKFQKLGSILLVEDEKQLLLAQKLRNIYRYSSKSVYYIYICIYDKLKKLSDDKVMYATFHQWRKSSLCPR